MTRAEHLKWCKTRALEYLPLDPAQAVTSMLSDLRKHDETKGMMDFAAALGIASMKSEREARAFIEGFN